MVSGGPRYACLREREGVAVADELAHGEGVALGVARGEALVGRVEEDREGPTLESGRDGHPLLLRRIDARRVVRARVQHHLMRVSGQGQGWGQGWGWGQPGLGLGWG